MPDHRIRCALLPSSQASYSADCPRTSKPPRQRQQPLTVCLVVLGRHVERLEFLDVMFGDRPALSPPEIFYQRMLAGDPTEAAEKAEEFLKERWPRTMMKSP